MTLAAERLLDEFRSLPGSVERPRTFMEIAGYPHYENVCSNILAFFMDPEESHGLGTLVLDALISAGNNAEADEVIGGNVSVEREVATDRGRIDILITSNDHAILIENKIHANVLNPFDDYAAYLDHITNDRTKYKFLLTLHPTNEGSEWGFTNLTHEEFIGQMRSLLGQYVSIADTRHLTMFLDFLNTLENLRKGTRMDKEFVKFLAKRSDDIENLFSDLQHFRNELEEKAKSLQSLIDASHPSFAGDGVGPWSTLSCGIHHLINLDNDSLFQVSIRTSVNPYGWEIVFETKRKSDYSKLRTLLRQLDIPFEEGKRFVYPTRFDYDENLEEIRPVLQELVDKIATYRGA